MKKFYATKALHVGNRTFAAGQEVVGVDEERAKALASRGLVTDQAPEAPKAEEETPEEGQEQAQTETAEAPAPAKPAKPSKKTASRRTK
jgi:hypothetical protein